MNSDDTPIEQNFYALRRPSWDHWKGVKHARLWQAVALACDLDPGQYFFFDTPNLDKLLKAKTPEFEELLTLAKNAIVAGGNLKLISKRIEGLEEGEVALSNFGVWAKSFGHKLPSDFPWQDESTPFLNQGWPWGVHETKLLRDLAAAANKFWRLYDPSDQTTAPTNQNVIDWLKTQGVAERNAKVMATILRPEGLSPGPRK